LYAAHHGNLALVDLLSGHLGADIEAVDANGFSALILAVLTDR
jgi:ankyrin repeat protein